MGIAVAVITYDTPALNRKFADKYSVQFPILSDEKSVHAIAFGVFNESYPEGHYAYGTPHPGIFLVDRNGSVVAKYAEEDYRQRPLLQLIIDAGTRMTERPSE